MCEHEVLAARGAARRVRPRGDLQNPHRQPQEQDDAGTGDGVPRNTDCHAGLDMTNVFCDEEGQLPLEDAK